MSQITNHKITEIFCIADDFCKSFSQEFEKYQIQANDGKKHRKRKFQMSDSEIITIMICFHYGCFKNLKHYYLFYVAKHMSSEFPNLLSYNISTSSITVVLLN